jgi:hypothetical protein
MRRLSPFVRSATTVLTLSLFLPLCFAARKDRSEGNETPADKTEAEKWITGSIRQMYQIDELNSQYLLLSSAHKGEYHFGIALARIASIRSGGIRDGYDIVSWQDYTHQSADYLKFYGRARADSFAGALRYLAGLARQEAQAQQDATLQQFRAQAKAWREAASKPVMPEAAREHQVLAEYAFKQQETEKAVREYKSALDIFPTWPEGQFNLATLAGEQKDYGTAVLHMKEYLELVPDSPDTQAAKDSIIIWRDRLSSFLAEQNQAPAKLGKASLRGGFAAK